MDRSSVVAELALRVARQRDDQPLALRLCTAGAAILGAREASLALTSVPGPPLLVAVTGPAAETIEALQDVLGTGPRSQACVTRRPATLVVAPEPDDDGLWSLSDEVRDHVGPVRVLALPMIVSGSVLGVLSVHLDEHGALACPHDDAMVVAAAVGSVVLREVRSGRAGEDGRRTGHARVHRAMGMLVVRLRISPDDAFAVLRAHAFAHDLTVTEVADALLDRRLVFERDGSSSDDSTRGPSSDDEAHGSSDDGTHGPTSGDAP